MKADLPRSRLICLGPLYFRVRRAEKHSKRQHRFDLFRNLRAVKNNSPCVICFLQKARRPDGEVIERPNKRARRVSLSMEPDTVGETSLMTPIDLVSD